MFKGVRAIEQERQGKGKTQWKRGRGGGGGKSIDLQRNGGV